MSQTEETDKANDYGGGISVTFKNKQKRQHSWSLISNGKAM